MNTHEDAGAVALYWDFENIHAGALEANKGEGTYKSDNRFKPQEPVLDVLALVALAASFGSVAINSTYGNWQFFGRYRDALLETSVRLIQLLPAVASPGYDNVNLLIVEY